MKAGFYTIFILLLMCSCSRSLNVVTKFNSNKNKYTKGLNFSSHKKENSGQKKNLTEINNKFKINSIVDVENNQIILLDTINRIEKVNPTAIGLEHHSNKVKIRKMVLVKSELKTVKRDLHEYSTLPELINVNKNIDSDKKEKEYSLFLLVLLAFIIPFLAVGLKTNWDLVKVIIALLLWPTIFISILFALLVVYDILEF